MVMKHVFPSLACLAVILGFTACGKTVKISDTVSDIAVSDYKEISFQVQYCDPDTVTYTVCSSKENFLFYEGHEFAYIQKYVNGDWRSLIEQPQVSSGEFRWCAVSTDEQQKTISVKAQYGGRLEAGAYRLVAPCSLSSVPPQNSELEQPIYFTAEFEIKR